MKISRLFIPFCLLASIALASCKPGEVAISVVPESVDVDFHSTSKFLNITTDAAWSASVSEDWISVAPTQGQGNAQIKLTIQTNPDSGTRKGSVTISSGKTQKTVQVSQSGSDGVLNVTVSGGVAVFPKAGGDVNVTVEHSGKYTVSIPSDASSWLSYASTKAVATDKLVFTAKASSVTVRNAKVAFTLESGQTQYVDFIQGDGYVATGKVTYSDGTPAVGVSVSDGFKVAVTDANGSYTLMTRSDSWYIFVSYPSDAKITVSDGCPNFFKKYEPSKMIYDFVLTKQAVEKKFSLFAMADPQSHYQIRKPQKSADTDRFKNETVKALNARIAASSLPCYGVTLGDIAYSEGSRNSNPSLAEMKKHFAGVNMPVFQTMGNHDYTYFFSSSPLTPDATSSTLYLKAQRKFEETFGPVNLSFNRGNVHVVCMRNINYDSSTDASSYHGGFNNDQWEWFKADLANVPKTKMIVLCVHIPIVGLSGKENVSNVLNLMKQYTNSTVFSGHTHYYRGVPNVLSSGMYEHVHSAVCGQWWWSKMEGDGCPNGYTVYDFDDAEITNAHFYGVNDTMSDPNYQIRIYKGSIKTGGKYAYFQWPYDKRTYLINVFSGDARWKVNVYENDVLKGQAVQMANSRQNINPVGDTGKTHTLNSNTSQDWWAIGYHIGVCNRGTSGTSYQTTNFHMWKYTATSETAKIKVEAVDPYGNKYTCSDVISDGTVYPEYVKAPLTIF